MKIEVEHVFKYYVSLSYNLRSMDVPVYTNIDFMKKYDGEPCETTMPMCEQDIKNLVFTKEKIEELKKEFCKRIMESEDPFDISCVDWDGGYLVEESELLENQKHE